MPMLISTVAFIFGALLLRWGFNALDRGALQGRPAQRAILVAAPGLT